MSKNESNGSIKVGWILDSALPSPQFASAAVLNSALDLTDATAWQDFEVGPSDSADKDDRSLKDLGNAVSRGAASYSATLSMFRDRNSDDATSTYVQAFEAFRVMRTLGWLIVRVNQSNATDFQDGDTLSLYKLIADTVADDSEGDDSTKFTVNFLPQGLLHFHTQVGTAGTITGVAATVAGTIGEVAQLEPVCGDSSIVSRAKYVSADKAIATVSAGGTVKYVSAGTVDVTVSYGSAAAAIVQAVTIT